MARRRAVGTVRVSRDGGEWGGELRASGLRYHIAGETPGAVLDALLRIRGGDPVVIDAQLQDPEPTKGKSVAEALVGGEEQ